MGISKEDLAAMAAADREIEEGFAITNQEWKEGTQRDREAFERKPTGWDPRKERASRERRRESKRARDRARYWRDPGKKRSAARAYYETHRTEIRMQQKAYYQTVKDEYNARRRAAYAKKKEAAYG